MAAIPLGFASRQDANKAIVQARRVLQEGPREVQTRWLGPLLDARRSGLPRVQ